MTSGQEVGHREGTHEGRTVGGCRLCEEREPCVTVRVSRELLAQMTQEWSPPVQVRIDPPTVAGGHYEMICRTHECDLLPEPEPWRCRRCGSDRTVAVSLDGGHSRRRQCVPCGKVDPVQLSAEERA